MSRVRIASHRLLQANVGGFNDKQFIPHVPKFERPSLSQSKNNVIWKGFSSSSRIQASTPQHEFLIVIPDFPNTTWARAKARPGHIRDATPLIKSEAITYFGVTLSEDQAGTESINGSVVVMKAENEDEVRAFLERDEYTKSGVWNVKDAKISRFRSG